MEIVWYQYKDGCRLMEQVKEPKIDPHIPDQLIFFFPLKQQSQGNLLRKGSSSRQMILEHLKTVRMDSYLDCELTLPTVLGKLHVHMLGPLDISHVTVAILTYVSSVFKLGVFTISNLPLILLSEFFFF